MSTEPTTSSNAVLVLQHGRDARPAWLFAQDGRLIWRNLAAVYFLARHKKNGVKLAAPAEPIGGQIARVLRLGTEGRTSLSRIQFLAGSKPGSATCACTPLSWDGQQVLLIVGVDPIEEELLASNAADLTLDAGLWHGGALGEPPPAANSPPAEPEVAEVPHEGENGAAQAEADEDKGRLSSLAGRLMEDEQLFAPLNESDDPLLADQPVPLEAHERPAKGEALAPREPSPAGLFRVIGRYLRREEEEHADAEMAAVEAQTVVSDLEEPADELDLGDLSRLESDESDEQLDESPPRAEDRASEPDASAPVTTVDPESVERVSRYNFDELSRILNDRIGEKAARAEERRMADAPPGSILARQQQRAGSSLINLGGETLVLNRLPLGILVFRDQEVLFANRSITEMIGYDSVESLRSAGLAAIFPGGERGEAGPVNHLVQRDGTLMPVTARLQSISWHGRPALMLSASATEVRTGHEEAVRAFAQAFADTRGDGYFETDRSGTISAINPKALAELGDPQVLLVGKPLSDLVSQADLGELRAFLERPARFAETARPCLRVKAAAPDAEILIFAQGQAGIVSGYFGFIHRIELPAAPRLAAPAEPDAALLARLSRGVRRPLNTIIGFSDLIRSAAFGKIENERYLDYARDIKTAGEEIATLVDELDDYARLKDGRYLPQRTTIDLLGLLESCVLRIRPQANARRVIVRSALSERLPRVTADRASLAQAVLNLLASAIDQTPVGGAVVISAQQSDDGGIAIHVRDNSENDTDLSERFVVFRDGTGRDGQALAPVRSSVGLALTRSLLAVNAFSLSVDPAGSQGMLFSMLIPPDLVARD